MKNFTSNIEPAINCIWILFPLLFSCNKETSKEPAQLSIEKLYIVESDFFEQQTSKFFMDLFGYCELDKNFRAKTVIKSEDGNFYASEMFVPDSLREMISETVKNHWIDTTYVTSRGYAVINISNRNSPVFFLIMEKENGEKKTIRFRQNTLPEDLYPVYKYLYYDRKATIGKKIPLDNTDSLHRVFDKEIIYNMYRMPSPVKFAIPDNIDRLIK